MDGTCDPVFFLGVKVPTFAVDSPLFRNLLHVGSALAGVQRVSSRMGSAKHKPHISLARADSESTATPRQRSRLTSALRMNRCRRASPRPVMSSSPVAKRIEPELKTTRPRRRGVPDGRPRPRGSVASLRRGSRPGLLAAREERVVLVADEVGKHVASRKPVPTNQGSGGAMPAPTGGVVGIADLAPLHAEQLALGTGVAARGTASSSAPGRSRDPGRPCGTRRSCAVRPRSASASSRCSRP